MRGGGVPCSYIANAAAVYSSNISHAACYNPFDTFHDLQNQNLESYFIKFAYLLDEQAFCVEKKYTLIYSTNTNDIHLNIAEFTVSEFTVSEFTYIGIYAYRNLRYRNLRF